MATFTGSDDLRGAEFAGVDLRGRFVEADLSGVVLRAVDVAEAEIDAPWLFGDGSSLRIERTCRGHARARRGDAGGHGRGFGRRRVVIRADAAAAARQHPWDPEARPTIFSCLQVILNEEWEHHRFAVRDLDAIEAKSSP